MHRRTDQPELRHRAKPRDEPRIRGTAPRTEPWFRAESAFDRTRERRDMAARIGQETAARVMHGNLGTRRMGGDRRANPGFQRCTVMLAVEADIEPRPGLGRDEVRRGITHIDARDLEARWLEP